MHIDTAQPATDFAVGDRVTWTNPTPGTFWASRAAGLVVRSSAKQVLVELRFRPLFSRGPAWNARTKWVKREEVRPRTLPSAAHFEKLEVHVNGFVLTPWKHPNGVSTQFPNGTFYGAVDGCTCTAPCSDPEAALEQAGLSLSNGGYRAGLLTAIETYGHWLEQGVNEDGQAEARDGIADSRARLLKLFEAMPEQRRDGDTLYLTDEAATVAS